MFTGIVTHKAPVTSAEISEGILRLILSTQDGFTDRLTTGASISVNGVCLTVVAFDANTVAFDVIDESLRLTNLSDLKSTHLVNLERAAPLSETRLGGICSQGISKLKQRSPSDARRITTSKWVLTFDPKWQKYVIAKGYIAVNGCSLTIGRVEAGSFSLTDPRDTTPYQLGERDPWDEIQY